MSAVLSTRPLVSVLLGAALATHSVALVQKAFREEPDQVSRSHGNVRVVDRDDLSRSFAEYKISHGRTYAEDSAEHQLRRQLFEKRAKEVQRHNSKADRRWTAAVNMFADRTDDELDALKGWRLLHPRAHQDDDEKTGLEHVNPPRAHNWLHLANAAFIRDQGGCGSCWAVTASTVLGFHSEIHSSNRTFSTQEIVDCVPNPRSCGGTGGCQGATVELAFQYAMLVGLRDPDTYGAYTARDGTCDWKPSESTTPSLNRLTHIGAEARIYQAESGAQGHGFGMTAWQKLTSNREKPLLQALYSMGPVAIALAANSIMSYSHGVFDGCGKDWTVNHAVTLIGYAEDYWLIQNSWGMMWGEAGRIRIHRTSNEEDNCGTDFDPQQGMACEGETDPVTVCGACGILYDSVVPIFHQD